MKKMRTVFFVVNILYMISYQSLCQVAPDTIVVNFLNLKLIPKYKLVAYGHKYVMKIENINKCLFKVEGKVSQQDYNTELPDIFKGIKFPGYLTLEHLAGPQAKTSVTTTVAPCKPSEYLCLIKKCLDIINKTTSQIVDAAILNNNMKNLFSSCDKPYKVIQAELDSIVNIFLKGTASSGTKDLSAGLKSVLELAIQKADSSNEALDILVPKYLNSIDVVLKYNVDSIISEWNKEPSKKGYPDCVTMFHAYKNTLDENELLNNCRNSLKAVVTKANESVTELKEFRDDNKIHDLVNNYNMINYSNFTYLSDPVKVKSDEVKFDIKITSDKPIPCNTQSMTCISETYKTKGGCKLDFSTGVFINWGNQDFLGRELQYKPVNDSVETIQSKDGGKRVLLSVGALMHIYYRSCGNVNFALSPGLSTTSAFDGLNFHLGGSVIFGGENRFVITGGVVLRESKILDKNYKLDTQYIIKSLPDSPPTIKVFPTCGWFFSLTYNFSRFTTQ
jgi:hypothetical protein